MTVSPWAKLLGRGQVRSGALGGGFTFKLAPFRPEDRGTYDAFGLIWFQKNWIIRDFQ
jgi:hypothetical protein